MKVYSGNNFLAAFSDASDGDLSFYNFAPDAARQIWQNFDVVRFNGLITPATAAQVHGDDIIVCNGAVTDKMCVGRGDAVVTTLPDQPVGVYTADCLPLLIIGDAACAAVHAGWKSTLLNISAKTINFFKGLFLIY